MDTNTIGRLYQAGRNTVRKQDFDPPRRSRAAAHDGQTERQVADLPSSPVPAKRSRGKRRIENFLTETLSILIWSDWRPIARALANARLLDVDGVEVLEPATQQRVGTQNSKGTIDLVLHVHRGGRRAEELWLEVKAGAGFHGNQPGNYLSAIDDAADGSVRRQLIVIDYGNALGLPRGVGRVAWQQLHDAVLPTDGRLWRDFADFLVDQELARPFGADLSSTVSDATTAELLAGVLQQRPDWPDWVVWTKGTGPSTRGKTLRTAIVNQSGKHGPRAIRLWARSQYTSLALGLFDRDGPAFGVQLTMTRWYPVAQAALRHAVEQAALNKDIWESSPQGRGDSVVAAYRPIAGDPDLAEVASWMVERVRDLDRSGLLADLDANGRKVVLERTSVTGRTVRGGVD